MGGELPGNYSSDTPAPHLGLQNCSFLQSREGLLPCYEKGLFSNPLKSLCSEVVCTEAVKHFSCCFNEVLDCLSYGNQIASVCVTPLLVCDVIFKIKIIIAE